MEPFSWKYPSEVLKFNCLAGNSYLTLVHSFIPLLGKLELQDPVSGMFLMSHHNSIITCVHSLTNRHYVPISSSYPWNLLKWNMFRLCFIHFDIVFECNEKYFMNPPVSELQTYCAFYPFSMDMITKYLSQ